MMNRYHVEIYRSQHDSSNGGITRYAQSATLFREERDADRFVAETCDPGPVLVLDTKPVTVMSGPVPRIRALPINRGGRHHMFGGAFCWSIDSRFRQEVCEYPIPVHDRTEG